MKKAATQKHAVNDNGFLPMLDKALRKTTKQDLTNLEALFVQGDFNYYLEDFSLFIYLSGIVDGGKYFTYNELVGGTKLRNEEELPSIMAGLDALNKKGLIRVTWAPTGLREKSPFFVSMPELPKGFRVFLDDLNDAFKHASLSDLKHLRILFTDHPELFKDFFKFGCLVFLTCRKSDTFTFDEIIAAFSLDQKEDRAKVMNSLAYLNKQNIVSINYTGPEAGTFDPSRMRTLFKMEDKENE